MRWRATERAGRLPALMLPALVLTALACAPPSPQAEEGQGARRVVVPPVAADYLDRYFQTFPSRAVAAGRYDLAGRLERLDAAQRRQWLEFNRRTEAELARQLAGGLPLEDRLDLELLLRRVRLEQLTFGAENRPGRDPLFWSGLASNAVVLLLVREDRPAAERLAWAADRAEQIPRLLDNARDALTGSEPPAIAPELARLAAGQARASAGFFEQGLAGAASEAGLEELRPRLEETGRRASSSLRDFAGFLDQLAESGTGTFRLGAEAYARRFQVVTGIERPVPQVLAQAETALADKVAEAAAFGRRVWPRWLPNEAAPAEDRPLLRRLLARVEQDHAANQAEFAAHYRSLIEESIAFVQERQFVTLPEPLTLQVMDRSPDFFLGQSVGGVYPAGPYAPAGARTLLFLPTPPPDADPERQAEFFRDFNAHFNRMITPHEIIPGHYLQGKYAARHPRTVRALFGDGVFIEGWGTFCERLMLDLGWGDDLDRLAHLKKQIENIARTIVDIRVHTAGMERSEVLRFVVDEALQREQFAGNMWRRAMTSSPQLTTYFLGYSEVMGLYQEVQAARGEGFRLREFTDSMMAAGPVPVPRHRSRLLAPEVR